MKSIFLGWPFWALLSAGFAAMTAIFAKVGVENVNSDFATFIRTIVILAAAGMMVYVTENWQSPGTVSGRSWVFLVLSGLATGASWICYFRALKLGDAARVAPIDKLSVVFVAIFAVLFLGERLSLPNWLGVCLIACGAILVAYRAESRSDVEPTLPPDMAGLVRVAPRFCPRMIAYSGWRMFGGDGRRRHGDDGIACSEPRTKRRGSCVAGNLNQEENHAHCCTHPTS